MWLDIYVYESHQAFFNVKSICCFYIYGADQIQIEQENGITTIFYFKNNDAAQRFYQALKNAIVWKDSFNDPAIGTIVVSEE